MNGSTKESAYTLGFIWGDGYIYRKPEKSIYQLSIKIVKTDMDEIQSTILSTGDWTSASQVRPNRRPQSILQVNNKILVNYLIDNQYGPKTDYSACNILGKINPLYVNYWIRGLVDADGCFYYNKKHYLRHFSLCSSYCQDWIFFTKILDEQDIKYSYSQRIEYPTSIKPQKHSVIRITDYESIRKFGMYIYGKEWDKIGLSRKYNKFQDILSSKIS